MRVRTASVCGALGLAIVLGSAGPIAVAAQPAPMDISSAKHVRVIKRAPVVRVAPRRAIVTPRRVITPRVVTPRRVITPRVVAPRRVIAPRVGRRDVIIKKRIVVPVPPPGVLRSGKKKLGPVGPVVSPAIQPVVKLPKGPGGLGPVGPKPVGLPVVKIGNKVAPIIKGQKLIWIGKGWKKFVPLTVLGVVVIGGGYYYADGHVAFARPYCSGITPAGCRLHWQFVELEDGGAEQQCGQYCPRPGGPPPQVAALAPPPPPPAGGACEVVIYPEPAMGGTPVPTKEDQPLLSASGWQNQIASLEVKGGTWDFFTEENFTGNTMRLYPGPYPDLGAEWTKRIGSFMCVQPGG